MLVLIPPGIVLCAGVNLAIGAHHELVLDLCTVDLAVGIDCFSCLIARAEPQRGKLCRFCSVIAVGGFVRIYFNIFQTTRLRTTIVFFFTCCTKHPGQSTKTFGSIVTFFTLS